jgi:hypothetical protein
MKVRLDLKAEFLKNKSRHKNARYNDNMETANEHFWRDL